MLQDFVGQELPALNQHMFNHGIEMTAVAFGWFLSLFTDCREYFGRLSHGPVSALTTKLSL